MRGMVRALVVLLSIAAALPAHAQASRDLDEVYQKPSGPTWGEVFRSTFGGSGFGRSYALVIGISDYFYWPHLDASLEDAKRVRNFLIQDAGFDYVHTLTNAKVTRARIDELMQESFPRRLGKEDRFLFYFSGHGTQRDMRRGMMGYLPLITAERQGYASMISMDDVERWSQLLGDVRQTLFVLDACFSGLAGVQRKGPLSDKTLAGLSQYGHHLITAGTASEESVASLKLWGGSLFTDAFLRGASGRADASTPEYPPDGVVSLKELVEYIRHRIDFESQKNRIRMSPQISDLEADNAGEFFFLARTSPIVSARPIEETGSAIASPKGATPDTASTPPPAPVEPTASEIAQAQTLLAEFGYNPGPADGSLGRRTRSAVEAYQRRAGLPVDGAITPDLLASLLRVPSAPQPAQPVQPAVGVYPRAYNAFEGFKECDECPIMVALPGGTFTMGSPANEEGRDNDEGPQHPVTIAPFAIGKTEVTFDQWDACLAAGGCNGYRPGAPWGRGSQPVFGGSWDLARAYVVWLAKRTGKPYRLPTEAEWEYAARAGTVNPFSFDATITQIGRAHV